VRELCNTLLSAYLIQLLDTGLLHADPHPGNLIRTTDGKICVLDFGLMTEVTPEQRIALVEYIAHLTIQVRHCCLSVVASADTYTAKHIGGSQYSLSAGTFGQTLAPACCLYSQKPTSQQHMSLSSSGVLAFSLLFSLHLSVLTSFFLQDWENVARDLQTLGFIPADAGDPVAMGMAEPLGKILVQLSGGGGATKLNIDAGEACCCSQHLASSIVRS
jgi:hypothetical protein